MKCKYGCGKKAIYKDRCNKSWNKCLALREKNKNSLIGRIKSEETCKKISAGRKGKALGRRKEICEYKSAHGLRKAYKEKYGDKCQKCNWSEVNVFYNLIPTELHHKDGNDKNNDENNLELLCPNCHSLTKYYMFYGRKHTPANVPRIGDLASKTEWVGSIPTAGASL